MSLTTRELEILKFVFQSAKSPIQVDYPQLAELAGFKTAASATTAYCSIKKKLLSINSANKSANPEKAKSTSGTKEAGKGNQSKKRDSSGKGIMGDEGDIFPVQHNGTSTTDDGDSKPKKRRRTPKKATTSSNDRKYPDTPPTDTSDDCVKPKSEAEEDEDEKFSTSFY